MIKNLDVSSNDDEILVKICVSEISIFWLPATSTREIVKTVLLVGDEFGFV